MFYEVMLELLFTDEGTEAQRGSVTYTRKHSR